MVPGLVFGCWCQVWCLGVNYFFVNCFFFVQLFSISAGPKRILYPKEVTPLGLVCSNSKKSRLQGYSYLLFAGVGQSILCSCVCDVDNTGCVDRPDAKEPWNTDSIACLCRVVLVLMGGLYIRSGN